MRDHHQLPAHLPAPVDVGAAEHLPELEVPPADQREFAARERIPYPLLSDSALELARTELRLPTSSPVGSYCTGE